MVLITHPHLASKTFFPSPWDSTSWGATLVELLGTPAFYYHSIVYELSNAFGIPPNCEILQRRCPAGV